MVAEHIHKLVLGRVHRARHSNHALELVLTLTDQAPFPYIDVTWTWINKVLESAAEGRIEDRTFFLFLRLRGLRKQATIAHISATNCEADTSHQSAVGYPLFSRILEAINTCSEQEHRWEGDAIYGGLLAIRDIRGIGTCPPEGFLKTFFDAMEDVKTLEASDADERNWIRPWRVRKAAYDLLVAVQDKWLRSAGLRQTLRDLDFPRRLYSVVSTTGHSEQRGTFLVMMKILSEYMYWHSCLRGAMDIWLPIYHDGLKETIHILANVGGILSPCVVDSSLPGSRLIVDLVENEWTRVPGRRAADLSTDLLEPVVEVTKQLKKLSFEQKGREEVLATVEEVVPSLERQRDGGEGSEEGICGIFEDLLADIRVPDDD